MKKNTYQYCSLTYESIRDNRKIVRQIISRLITSINYNNKKKCQSITFDITKQVSFPSQWFFLGKINKLYYFSFIRLIRGEVSMSSPKFTWVNAKFIFSSFLPCQQCTLEEELTEITLGFITV